MHPELPFVWEILQCWGTRGGYRPGGELAPEAWAAYRVWSDDDVRSTLADAQKRGPSRVWSDDDVRSRSADAAIIIGPPSDPYLE